MANKILVPLSIGYGSCIRNLGKITSDVSSFFRNPKDFKLVLFTGGSDVSPELYNETSPKKMCMSNSNRDAVEEKIFKYAVQHDIKMTGICRGVQLINVLCGGKMLHHVSNHAGTTHAIRIANGEVMEVNSLHHQMCVTGPDVITVGWATPRISSIYWGNKDKQVSYEGVETEVIIAPNKKACGVQYHPEMMSEKSDGYKFFNTFIANFLTISTESFIKCYTHKEELMHNVHGI